MGNQSRFIQKMQDGDVCLGTCITFSDPAITEALSPTLDFAWIETEHNPLSLETVQAHIMATKGSECTALVRVPSNNPVLIKPVLDIGAAGVIVPMVSSASDAHRAVEACLYPPGGVRGYGPRRPSNYGRRGGPDFCREANESVIVIPQLEHINAVKEIDAILKVPGISALAIGPNDLSGSMGLLGQPRHPEVVSAINTIIEAGVCAGVPVGMAAAGYEDITRWVTKGAKWIAAAADYIFITQAVDELFSRVRIKSSLAATN
jgi:2-keto-3-deoxy-L-rhamnonate aldolase RhmA